MDVIEVLTDLIMSGGGDCGPFAAYSHKAVDHRSVGLYCGIPLRSDGQKCSPTCGIRAGWWRSLSGPLFVLSPVESGVFNRQKRARGNLAEMEESWWPASPWDAQLNRVHGLKGSFGSAVHPQCSAGKSFVPLTMLSGSLHQRKETNFPSFAVLNEHPAICFSGRPGGGWGGGT